MRRTPRRPAPSQDPPPRRRKIRKRQAQVVDDPSRRHERAFLVGIDYGRRTPELRQASIARDAASLSGKQKEKNDGDAVLPFDAEASLAELRELAESAGAEVVGEVLQKK